MEKDAQGSQHWVRKIDLVGSSEGFRFTLCLQSNTREHPSACSRPGGGGPGTCQSTQDALHSLQQTLTKRNSFAYGNTEKTQSKVRKETCDYRGIAHPWPVTWNSLIRKPGAFADQTATHSPMVTGFAQQTEYNAHAFKYTKRLSREDTETVTSQANYTDFFVLQVQRLKNAVGRPSSPLYQIGKEWKE